MFDTVNRYNGRPRVCTKEIMHEILTSEAVAKTCRGIETLVKTKIGEVERRIAATSEPGELAALEKEEKAWWEEVARRKKRLPAFCFQAHYPDGRRRNKSARPSGLCMFDMDDVDSPETVYQETAERIKALGTVMVHITPSTRGLRYVFRIPAGMDIAQAQGWFAEQLGISTYDGCTKDMARISFAVPEKYVLMMDEKMFEDAAPSQCLNVSNIASGEQPAEAGGQREAACQAEEAGVEQYEQHFKGIPYQLIIERLLLSMGVDGDPAEGERNTTLYNLVRQLRYICDFSPAKLMAVVPRWALSEEEVKSTVMSALATVRRSELPPHLERTLRVLAAQQKELDSMADCADGRKTAPTGQPMKREQPVPGRLPRFFELLTKSYPEEYHAAILTSALPILGTLATRARAMYFDSALHSPSFLTCIVAPQASGKSCTRRLVELLLGTLQLQDNQEREKEHLWMEEKRARKNSKQQPEDPRAKIRIVPATISNAMLFKRLDCSEGEHLFTYAEEIDTLSKGRKSGTWSQKDDIMRQAFDNSICGQDYMSDNSWSAMVKVHYNMLSCGTPVAVHRYYNDVEGGLVSRVCFSQLPDMLGAQMPIFGRLTKEEEAEVERTAQKLTEIGRTAGGAEGTGKRPSSEPVEYEIPKVKEAIWKWLEERRLEYLETQENPALDIFRRRAAVIGFRAGLLAALVSDERETDEAVAFAVWVAGHTLAGQISLFGEEMNRVMTAGDTIGRGTLNATYYQSLLSTLPDKFSIEQLVAIRMQAGYKSPVRQVIWRWKQNGLIRSEGNEFVKVK